MAVPLSDMQALELWRLSVLAGVRRETPDLSARQMAVLLSVYLTPPPHTVRGLATLLSVSKPAITRALDRLSELEMIRRKIDESDRRNVLIQRTIKGSIFLRDWGGIVSGVAKHVPG